MMQSKLYVFSPDFSLSNRKLDFEETKILWRINYHPDSTTIGDVMKVLFDARDYGKKVLFVIISFILFTIFIIFSIAKQQILFQ